MNQPRLLVLTRYHWRGASSRLRFGQYLPLLERAGWEISAHGLLTDRYLDSLYRGVRPSRREIAARYASRIRQLVSASRFDLVWVQGEMLPWLPALVERAFTHGVPIVLDYDDAIFHKYDRHRSWLVRKLLSNKIAALMRGADLVVAGNSYIADYARRAGASRVEWLPTVVDLTRYVARTHRGREPTVVWIGTPITAGYVASIVPALARSGISGGRLRLIGAGGDGNDFGTATVEPWTEESEARALASADIGIMPLPDGDWERGKSGYKLIQYMAAGLPVVASPVGANRDIVQEGVTGWFARSPEEWREKIRSLSDPGVRQQMGEAGRRRVEEHYSLQVSSSRLIRLLNDLRASSPQNVE